MRLNLVEADLTLTFARQKNIFFVGECFRLTHQCLVQTFLLLGFWKTSSELHLVPVTVHLLKRRKVLVLLVFCLSLSVLCMWQWISISTSPSLFGTEFFKSAWNGEGNGTCKGSACWWDDWVGALTCTRLYPRKALQIEMGLKKTKTKHEQKNP